MFQPLDTRGNSQYAPPPYTGVNSGSSGSRVSRGMVPTAKVPNYLNRVKQSVRDTRPGLLPTPNIPPLRQGQLTFDVSPADSAFCRRVHAYSTPYEDVYATPYSRRSSQEYMRENSIRSSNSAQGESVLNTPSSAGTLHALLQQESPAQVESMRKESISDQELIGSLLNLLIESEAPNHAEECFRPQQHELNADLLASIAGFYEPHSTTNANIH